MKPCDISVLLPARGRVDLTYQALRSLAELASDPSRFEIIMRIDSDDTALFNASTLFTKEFKNLRLIIGPRGNGYRDLPMWFDYMISRSNGGWLWLFNNDSRVETKGWDNVIRLVPIVPRIEPWLLETNISNNDKANDFPIISRKLYDIIGSLGSSPCSDVFLWDVVVPNKMMSRVGISSAHDYVVDDNHAARGDNLKVHQSSKVQSEIKAARDKLSKYAKRLLAVA